jgi:ferredoxin
MMEREGVHMELGKRIAEEIARLSANEKANDLHKSVAEPAWGAPLIGFANGSDSIFEEIKTEIGAFHWLPIEAWKHAFPCSHLESDDISVISAVFPQTAATREAQEKEEMFPAENWVRSRYYWEDFVAAVSKEFTRAMRELHITAIAPVLLPDFSRVHSKKHNYSSKWSERHIAYASGLGTFGYSEGLITPVGKAVRILSFLVDRQLDPTPRPYASRDEYCLYYSKGTCKKCVARCPAGSLTGAGHDKDICAAYAYDYTPETEQRYGFPNQACGLCQVKVPCESGLPK